MTAAVLPPEGVLEIRGKTIGLGELLQSLEYNILNDLAERVVKYEWPTAGEYL